jgi:hypothetical protein
MTTAAPPLTGQDINLAARATRLVLLAGLDTIDLPFEDWIIINLVGTGQAVDRSSVRGRLISGLGLDEASIDQRLSDLEAANLVDRSGDRLRLSAEGGVRWNQGQAVVAETVATLYAGLDPDDLAVARRVLVEVTARAEAELTA